MKFTDNWLLMTDNYKTGMIFLFRVNINNDFILSKNFF